MAEASISTPIAAVESLPRDVVAPQPVTRTSGPAVGETVGRKALLARAAVARARQGRTVNHTTKKIDEQIEQLARRSDAVLSFTAEQLGADLFRMLQETGA